MICWNGSMVGRASGPSSDPIRNFHALGHVSDAKGCLEA